MYVLRYKNLQLYLRVRINITKVHRVLEFDQSKWLKRYIELDTQKRIETEENDEKDRKAFYKLINNAVYGNKMENLRNRVDVTLGNNKNDCLKWTSKPSYIAQNIFDNDLVALHKIKNTLRLNKPEYNRMCVLELNKVSVYEFHYNYIKNKYDNKSRLLFTNTDSFVYEIKTENAYDDFNKNKEMFDFRKYSAKSKYYDYSNALVFC